MKDHFIWLISGFTVLISLILIIVPSLHIHSNGFTEAIVSEMMFTTVLVYIIFLLLLLFASFSFYESFFKQVLRQIIISFIIIFISVVTANVLSKEQEEVYQKYAELDKTYKYEKLYNVPPNRLVIYFKNKNNKINNYELDIDSNSNNQFTLLKYSPSSVSINDTTHYIGIPKGDDNCSRLIILGPLVGKDSLNTDASIENTFNKFSPYYP